MMEKHICIFILNLKKVSYIDSSGIGALCPSMPACAGGNGVSHRQRCEARMHVMQLTKLVGFLPIDTTELEAIEAVAGRKRPVR